MNANFLADVWRDVAPALGNHIWQSTIFAAVMAAVALAFRHNRAHTRYWLWLAASLKFLFPFSVLVGVGRYLAIPHAPTATKAAYYAAFEQFGQPFAGDGLASIARSAPAPTAAVQPLTHYLPLLLILWLIGSVVVLAVWIARWHRVAAIAKNGTPIQEGAEAAIIAQLQQNADAHEKIAIVSTAAKIEPGIFGIFKPILLWPASISRHLTEAHTESIVAHELCHVRRRDNLTATLHMLVESLFWFHPAVWWLGNRLVEDRERACDEAVVESGREPQVYAESILKVCEFCVESPLPCVPGVSGADLKRRIASIMSYRPARALSVSRKLLLSFAVVLAIAAPILAGAFHAPANLRSAQPLGTAGSAARYSSVSIMPSTSGGSDRVVLMIGLDQFVSKNASLLQVIRQAYGVEDDRIVNAPAWLTKDKYDFVATTGSPIAGQSLEGSGQIQRQMLVGVLADRLKLSAHLEARNIPVYALVISKNGPKLSPSTASDSNSTSSQLVDGSARRNGFQIHGTALIGQDVPIDALVFHLSRQLHRTVLNETGLSGTYEFTLKAPDGVSIGIDNSTPPESYESNLSSALTEQLGLALEPRETKMEVLVIDHVEKPSASESQVASPEAVPVPDAHLDLAAGSVSFGEVTIKPDAEATAKLKANSGLVGSRVMLNNGELSATGVTVHSLIMMAFKSLEHSQITGGPDWINSEVFTIHAKADAAVVAKWPDLTKEQKEQVDSSLMQNLLASNFGLKFHREPKVEPIYALVVDNPSKLNAFDGECPPLVPGAVPNVDPEAGPPPCGSMFVVPGQVRGTKIRISPLVEFLSMHSGRIVEDRTNLTKRYDVNLKFTPDPNEIRQLPQGMVFVPPDPNGPSLFDALVQQMGLKLVPQTGPVEMLVVDEATMPAGTSGGK